MTLYVGHPRGSVELFAAMSAVSSKSASILTLHAGSRLGDNLRSICDGALNPGQKYELDISAGDSCRDGPSIRLKLIHELQHTTNQTIDQIQICNVFSVAGSLSTAAEVCVHWHVLETDDTLH